MRSPTYALYGLWMLLVIIASGLTPKLKGLISANGFFNSPRVQQALRGDEKNKKFLAWLQEERGKRGYKEYCLIDDNFFLTITTHLPSHPRRQGCYDW